MEKEILRFTDVKLIYHTKRGETTAAENLNFSVNEGEFVAIIGPSGCGKTTLLSLAAGLLKPSSGTIESHGSFGYMLQKDQLFQWRTIEKNIFLPLEIKRINTPEHRDREKTCGEIRIKRLFAKLSPATFGRNAPTGCFDPYVGDKPRYSVA